jgi:hypothetical protein
VNVYEQGIRLYFDLEQRVAPPNLRRWLSSDPIRVEQAQRAIRRGLRRGARIDAPATVDAVIAAIRAEPPMRFSTDGTENNRTIERFRQAGAQESIVNLGGFRFTIQSVGNILISIQPNAKSAQPKFGGRLGFTLWSQDRKPGKGSKELGGRVYSFARWDQPERLREAINLAIEAFQRANGDIDLFYEAVGEAGQCAICSRFLTDPLSRARGIGPECIKTLWAGFAQYDLDALRAEAVRRARAARA